MSSDPAGAIALEIDTGRLPPHAEITYRSKWVIPSLEFTAIARILGADARRTRITLRGSGPPGKMRTRGSLKLRGDEDHEDHGDPYAYEGEEDPPSLDTEVGGVGQVQGDEDRSGDCRIAPVTGPWASAGPPAYIGPPGHPRGIGVAAEDRQRPSSYRNTDRLLRCPACI